MKYFAVKRELFHRTSAVPGSWHLSRISCKSIWDTGVATVFISPLNRLPGTVISGSAVCLLCAILTELKEKPVPSSKKGAEEQHSSGKTPLLLF